MLRGESGLVNECLLKRCWGLFLREMRMFVI